MAGAAQRFVERMMTEIGAELKRIGDHGRSEFAAGLFRGDAYVMYGPTQRAGSVEQDHSVFGASMSSPENSPNMEQHQIDRTQEMSREMER
jgi:hypothetical protein